MHIPARSLVTLLAGHTLLGPFAEARSVFCHYMVNQINEGSGHAETDVSEAAGAGIDAFALNIGNPGADWAKSTIAQLFDAASESDFKLLFSLDLAQESDLAAYDALLSEYLPHPSYLRAGPNDLPLVSTFTVAGHKPDELQSWKGDRFHFIPHAEDSEGYYDDSSAWFGTWGEVVDGVLGWETSWPSAGEGPANAPTNVSNSIDTSVLDAAHANNKTYIAPLSSFQYKNCCGGHYYRGGESNLPERMTQILDMSPDFVEILTWNDAGEGHYIANGWPEGLSPDITSYANTTEWPHFGWQPVITSFISAYKSGGDPSTMAPPPGSQAIGAMWYRTFPKDAPCAGSEKPDGWESAVDAVNYAVVVAADSTDLTIRVTSGGDVTRETPAVAGLNYGSVTGMNLGEQKVELVGGDSAVLTAASTVDVASDSSNCNFNYQVVGLE